MLPLEIILGLIKRMQEDTVAAIGQGRDTRDLGVTQGRLAVLDELTLEIDRIVEESNSRGEDQ